MIANSPDEPRRVRLMDPAGEETARLSGVLAWEEGKSYLRLVASDGGLLVAVTIPLDSDTRCTNSPDGSLTTSYRVGRHGSRRRCGQRVPDRDGRRGPASGGAI